VNKVLKAQKTLLQNGMTVSVFVYYLLIQTVYGDMPMDKHHAGEGGGMMFLTQDVMHSPVGGIFAGRAKLEGGNEPVDPGQVNKAIDLLSMYENMADLGDKGRQLEKIKIEEKIAAGKRKAVRDKLRMLKRLQREAQQANNKKREIVGARVIPTVVLPLHYPLGEHGRYARKRFERIKRREQKLLDAQRKIAKLHDITDQVHEGDTKGDEHMFNNFFKKGKIDNYAFNVPVVPQEGSQFYFASPGEQQQGVGNHITPELPAYNNGSYTNNNLHSQLIGAY